MKRALIFAICLLFAAGDVHAAGDDTAWRSAVRAMLASPGEASTNGLADYFTAYEMLDAPWAAEPLARSVKGPLAESADPAGEAAARLLASAGEAISALLAGNARSRAAWPAFEESVVTPVPQFARFTFLSRLIELRGLRAEARGVMDEAIHAYGEQFKFATRIADEQGVMISKLVQIAQRRNAARRLSALVRSGALDASQLARVAAAVESDLDARPPLRAFFDRERRATRNLFAAMKAGRPDALAGIDENHASKLRDLDGGEDAAIEFWDGIWPRVLESVTGPFDPAAQDAITEEARKGPKGAAWMLPGSADARVRDLASSAETRLASLAARVAAWRSGHGALPRSLDQLPAPEAAKIDPFTGGAMRMIATEDGVIIYSVGPDLADQRGAEAFDISKGFTSTGDIAVRIR